MATTDHSIKNVSPETKTAARKRPAKGADQRFKQAQRLSSLLKHVSDPTRIQIILILCEGEQHVGSLCDFLGQSQPAVSHHLALLRHGGVIAPRRQGKNNYYSLTDKGDGLSEVVKRLIV
jgi:DNA-binding transcriptional ArsR family regulator